MYGTTAPSFKDPESLCGRFLINSRMIFHGKRLPEGKSHKIPLNHHFPMFFIWFSSVHSPLVPRIPHRSQVPQTLQRPPWSRPPRERSGTGRVVQRGECLRSGARRAVGRSVSCSCGHVPVIISLPVVPHKAVAEVSKIGNL